MSEVSVPELIDTIATQDAEVSTLKSEVAALRGQVHALQEEVHRLKTVLHGPVPQRYRIDKKLEGHSGKITALYWLADELLVSAADDDSVRIWDITTGQCLHVLDNVAPCLGVMSTGQHVLTIDADSLPLEVQIWDALSGRCLRRSSLSGQPLPEMIGDGHDRTENVLDRLETGGDTTYDDCMHISCHLLIPRRDISPGEDATPYRPPAVVVAGEKRISPQKKNRTPSKSGSAKSLSSSKKSPHPSSGRLSGGGKVFLRSPTSRNLLTTLVEAESSELDDQHQQADSPTATEERYSEEYGYMVENVSVMGDESDDRQMVKFEEEEYKELDDWLVVGGDDCMLRVMNVSTGCLIRILEGHYQTITAMAVVTSIVDTVPVNNSSAKHSFRRKFTHLVVLSASMDMTIRVWDVLNGVSLAVLTGHHSTIRCLSVLPPESLTEQSNQAGKNDHFDDDDKIEAYVVSGSEGGSLRLWSLKRIVKPRSPDFSGYGMANNFFDASTFTDEDSSSDDEEYYQNDSDNPLNPRSMGHDAHPFMSREARRRYGKCECLASIDNGHVESVTCLQTIAVHASSSATTNMLQAMSRSQMNLSSLPQTQPPSIPPSANSVSVISGSEDTTLRVWSVRTMMAEYDYEYCLLLQGHRAKVNFALPLTLPPSPSLYSMLTTHHSFNGESSAASSNSSQPQSMKQAIPDRSLLHSKSTSRLLTATSSSFYFHRQESFNVAHDGNDACCQLPHDLTTGQQVILSGGDDGAMFLWDAHSGDVIHTLHGHVDAVQCAISLDQIEYASSFSASGSLSHQTQSTREACVAEAVARETVSKSLHHKQQSPLEEDPSSYTPHRHHVLVSGGSRGVLYTWTWS